jgi:hypothetical protein
VRADHVYIGPDTPEPLAEWKAAGARLGLSVDRSENLPPGMVVAIDCAALELWPRYDWRDEE